MYSLPNELADLVINYDGDCKTEFLTIVDIGEIVHWTPSGILVYAPEEAVKIMDNYPEKDGWVIKFVSDGWNHLMKEFGLNPLEETSNKENNHE